MFWVLTVFLLPESVDGSRCRGVLGSHRIEGHAAACALVSEVHASHGLHS